jgi:dolichol-phosphate mannosyltransferase
VKKQRTMTKSLSIILPTYNESQNIVNLLNKIHDKLRPRIPVEVVVVDDNSPDGTGRLVENYARSIGTPISKTTNSAMKTTTTTTTSYDYEKYNRSGDGLVECLVCKGEGVDLEGYICWKCEDLNDTDYLIKVISRADKYGLMSAILQGIQDSSGEYILVMDADLSHSPEVIPMMIDEIQNSDYDIIIGSRYIKGGSIIGWPFRRRVISIGATKIAQYGLKIKVKDPMSGFFICKRHVLRNIDINTAGYKILLELLVKKPGINAKEIPYSFVNRKLGKSKMDLSVIIDYLKAVWILYRYEHTSKQASKIKRTRKSVLFFSKAARFYTVGASGLLINYSISSSLANGLFADISYMHATLIGIICSMTSNFLLNKRWTFEDKNFLLKRTLKQYGMFTGFSSFGAALQLLLVYLLTGASGFNYEISLFTAVAIASVSNFLLNKRWTFQERIWG